ncbi:MAG: hypothetical protein IH931_06260, partial [candidate division Zixibacteria bacterium]|nr:hypothetical protein [candidate division Zixibacteria bacterium]
MILIILAVLGLFMMVGALRAFRTNLPASFIYATLSLFFWTVHFVWLANVPDASILYYYTNMSAAKWLVFIFAPALVALFLTSGAYWYAKEGVLEALPRLFFGLTLLCLLYMLGVDWPLEFRGLLSFFWAAFLMATEFPYLDEKPTFVYQVRRLL